MMDKETSDGVSVRAVKNEPILSSLQLPSAFVLSLLEPGRSGGSNAVHYLEPIRQVTPMWQASAMELIKMKDSISPLLYAIFD